MGGHTPRSGVATDLAHAPQPKQVGAREKGHSSLRMTCTQAAKQARGSKGKRHSTSGSQAAARQRTPEQLPEGAPSAPSASSPPHEVEVEVAAKLARDVACDGGGSEREPKRSCARHVVLRTSVGDAGVATSAEGGAPDADEERQSTGRPRNTSAPKSALAEISRPPSQRRSRGTGRVFGGGGGGDGAGGGGGGSGGAGGGGGGPATPSRLARQMSDGSGSSPGGTLGWRLVSALSRTFTKEQLILADVGSGDTGDGGRRSGRSGRSGPARRGRSRQRRRRARHANAAAATAAAAPRRR